MQISMVLHILFDIDGSLLERTKKLIFNRLFLYNIVLKNELYPLNTDRLKILYSL